jgi:hypothetical protein
MSVIPGRLRQEDLPGQSGLHSRNLTQKRILYIYIYIYNFFIYMYIKFLYIYKISLYICIYITYMYNIYIISLYICIDIHTYMKNLNEGNKIPKISELNGKYFQKSILINKKNFLK